MESAPQALCVLNLCGSIRWVCVSASVHVHVCVCVCVCLCMCVCMWLDRVTVTLPLPKEQGSGQQWALLPPSTGQNKEQLHATLGRSPCIVTIAKK